MVNKLPKSILDFDQFLNEPPQYEDQRMVRDYRHDAYNEWKKVLNDVDAMHEALKLAEEALRTITYDDEEASIDLDKCKSALAAIDVLGEIKDE